MISTEQLFSCSMSHKQPVEQELEVKKNSFLTQIKMMTRANVANTNESELERLAFEYVEFASQTSRRELV